MNSTISLPKNTSHSARETLQRCARSWFLSRVARAPKRPAVWSVGGSAVHEVTEVYDLWQVSGNDSEFDVEGFWEASFTNHLAEARNKEPNENKWGRSAAEPIEVWRVQGLEFVRAYIDWRERSSWEIWTTPHGAPAIELDISGMLPGCPVEVRAYLDRIFWDPVFKKHHIVDLKTGKRPPKNADQFGTYKALTELKYGIDVTSGVAFLNRRASLGKPYDLTEFTPEFVGKVFGDAWEQVREHARTGSWPAKTTDCYVCDVQSSCYAVGGPLSAQYDPANPAYAPPF